MQPAQPAPTRVKVHVIRADFDAKDGIPADAQQEISSELRSRTFEPDSESAYSSDLTNEIAEVGVRGALRDRGYFKATATAQVTPLQTEGADISFVLSITVAPGPQHRTGDTRIESTDGNPLAIRPETLGNLIPLQRGELLSLARIRAGLESLGRAFEREGYVDMTPEAEWPLTHD